MPTTRVCIAIGKPGVYALVVYHDLDDNGKFDRSWIGLPLEPYGFSKNPRIGLSAPSFREVAFVVGPAGASVDIEFNE